MMLEREIPPKLREWPLAGFTRTLPCSIVDVRRNLTTPRMGVYFRLLLASSRRYQGETLYVFTVQKPITHSANPASEMNDAPQFVADLASVFWNSARNWPAKYGAGVREDFHGSFERSIEEVFEEIVYFLASSIDYALTKEIGKRLIVA